MKRAALDWQKTETTVCRYGVMSYLKADHNIGRSLREYGEWVQGEIDFLLDLITVGDTVVDAGAFLGTHTLAFARHVGPEGRVWSFEPHPVAFELLRYNLQKNQIANVELHNVGLSDSTGTVTLNEGDLADMDNPGGFSLLHNTEAKRVRDSCVIDIVTLDQLCISECDLIKIDVEGMELNVLRGAEQTLSRCRPLVFAECRSLENGWQTILLMLDKGYEALLHNERAFNPGNFRRNPSNFFEDASETNILFVPEDRRRGLEERYKDAGHLIPVNTLDGLALAMLKKPQYKYETLALTTAAGTVGVDFFANEPELRELANRASRVEQLEDTLDERAARVGQLETDLQNTTAQVHSLEYELYRIRHSIPLQCVDHYQRLVDRLLAQGTGRRYRYELALTGVRIILNEGWRSFWSRFRIWLRQQIAARKAARTLHSTADVSDELGDYLLTSRKIAGARRRTLEIYRPRPPRMISIAEHRLLTHAQSLVFPEEHEPQVSIIIPVRNNAKLTVECLLSIRAHTSGASYEIIVINDASSQETADILSPIKNIRHIRNPENRGFLLSCNRAAEEARGRYILIMNNDVQVTAGWLAPLIETFASHEKVGAVSPKILFPDGRLQEAGARIRQDASSQLIGLRDDPALPRYNYLREVDYCSGVCLMIESESFRELGGFDAAFAPAYYEDADLCLRLRSSGKRIMYNPNSVVVHHLSATMGADSQHKKQLAITNGQKLAEKWQEKIDELNSVRLIAFYLPQYHRIAENDRWWGEGFTDWANVTKAQPNFAGHHQPHVPTELGRYDLSNEDVMEQQTALARRYGIYGFCYYYYWFAGRRLLEMPLERMLETGRPDIPFCLCWANENWTRTWDGRDDLVLIAQQHSEDDDSAVISDLIRYMRHPNYIRINGKPLLLVYRVSLFPNIRRTTDIWREKCHKEGLGEIYLAMVESFEHATENTPPSTYGFDASVEYPPHHMAAPIRPPGKVLNPSYTGIVSDYRQVALRYVEKDMPGYTRFRTAMPGWDNTARRQDKSYVFAHSSPGAYQAWLEAILDLTLEQNFGDERIAFVSAWNEWAEGNHLEPDQRFGHGFLEATRNALERSLLTVGHREP